MNSGVEQPFNSHSKWYQRRTNLERWLILLTSVVALIALALIIALTTVIHKQNHYVIAKDVCVTPDCIHAASNLLKYMDLNVNPCDDFYDFSCGTFEKKTTIPEDKSLVSTFSTLDDEVRNQLKIIIEEPTAPNATRPYKLLKKYYELCMNTTAIEANGLKTIKTILKDLGGWPVLEGEDWYEEEFDWKESAYIFRKLGFNFNYFISFYIGTDNKNSTKRVIIFDQAILGIDREYLIKGLNDKLVKAHYDYMVDVAVIFGADKDAASKEMKESLEFEIKLAKICMPKEKRRNATELYNPMTIKQLQQKYPFINWLEYINNVLFISNITITDKEIVNMRVPKFIKDVYELIKKTPKRVQANYVMTRVALSKIYYLTEELRNRQTKYYQIIYGSSKRPPRWKECVGVASGGINLVTSSLYVQKYFDDNAKKHVEEMVGDIRNEFEKILNNNDWMDQMTKKNALDKAMAITSFVGYPSELLDSKKIEEYYANIEDPSDDYLTTSISLTIFYKDIYYRELRKPVNKTDWIDHSYTTIVNAFYSASENSIDLPVGILQGIFYNDHRPRYMNYGGIGFVIGHEITHGFDDGGRQYDKEGNVNNWWAEETKQAFIKKAQCIIDQYGNYTDSIIEINLNGINTQGENIADNGGIIEAYLAYQNWVNRNSPEQRLPGLNYTPNQLFWVSAAQIWCTKYRREYLKVLFTTSNHSPARYRVIGPFKNTEYFANDFDCPLGSKMNPRKKCQVW